MFGGSSFKQIDGVVTLEPNEEIRINDMALSRWEQLG